MRKRIFLTSVFLAASLVTVAVSCNKQTAAPANTNQPASSETRGQKSYSYNGIKGVNAMDLLEQIHQVKTKDFGPGLGKMVQSIEGVEPASDEFWAFYVNGKPSNVGASSYTMKDTDQIEWRLDKINSNQ